MLLQTISEQDTKQLFMVTGHSGAGKSTVLRALEDLGFFCVDNLPIELLDTFFSYIFSDAQNHKKIALGIDIRAGNNIAQLIQAIQTRKPHEIKTVFLTSSSGVLLKRFQETRRKHPLTDLQTIYSIDNAPPPISNDNGGKIPDFAMGPGKTSNFSPGPLDLADAIEQEKKLLLPLEQIADFVVDTDQFNIHQLRSFVRGCLMPDTKPRMLVSLISFGFKYGVPSESNFVFDLRSLPNPYFVPHLRQLDGTKTEIKEYLFNQPEVAEYWCRFRDFFIFSLEKSYQEGRSFMHIAIGCTGGRHRSVAFVQELASEQLDYVHFLVKHRDLTKDLGA